jgi:hypothetical protein
MHDPPHHYPLVVLWTSPFDDVQSELVWWMAATTFVARAKTVSSTR